MPDRKELARDWNGIVKITFASWYESEWVEARETIQTLNARLNIMLGLMVPLTIGVVLKVLF